MMGGWEGWERWTRARETDRRRAAIRNARILGVADRWAPTVEDGLASAMGRYLVLRFPDPSARPTVRIDRRADVPTQHAGSPRTVTWTVAVAGQTPDDAADVPALSVVLGSWRGRFGERTRFRVVGADHPASGDLARWLGVRLDAWLVAALGRHR